MVGACGKARKPLASLGLAVTAALRMRAVRAVGAGSRLVSHPNRSPRAKEDTMNRWTGTGHLTKDALTGQNRLSIGGDLAYLHRVMTFASLPIAGRARSRARRGCRCGSRHPSC
jgi:hypothetical protein